MWYVSLTLYIFASYAINTRPNWYKSSTDRLMQVADLCDNSLTDSPVPLWCRAGSSRPRCSCTVGHAAADFSRSLHPSPPPLECSQTGCDSGFRSGWAKWKREESVWWSVIIKRTDQSLILCSHSMMSFTWGGPPELQSLRALKDTRTKLTERDIGSKCTGPATSSVLW